MTTITDVSKTQSAPMAQGLIAFAGIVARRLKQFALAAKHRHDAAMLANLDDRMLADIGLTRGDLRDAFSRPLWQDPTVVLAGRISERRLYRRRYGAAAASSFVAAPSIVPAVKATAAVAGKAR
jgi:uncharacterized protein YjiS (DUF1127 family)